MTAEPGPTARQRRLAAELRRLRETVAQMTPEEAARTLGWSRTKLVKLETATRPPSVADVRHILDTYGGTDQAIKLALMNLAKEIRQRGWWAAYGDVLQGSYAQLEDAADRIRTWQPQVVPGILQNEEYARAVISQGSYESAEVDRRVQARIHRQTLLTRQDAPSLEVVLAEEALRRAAVIGLLQAQAQTLLVAMERPNIDIRVLPVSAGFHRAMGQGSLVIFEFPGPVDLSVAYLETMAGAQYVEDVAQVAECNVKFDRIASAALSQQESAAFLAAIAKE